MKSLQGDDFYAMLNNKKELRKLFINNDSAYQQANSWMLDTPYDIRDNVLLNILHNYKTNIAKKKPFDINFKKKKDIVSSMDVLAKYWNTGKKSKYHPLYDMSFESSNQRLHRLPATSRLIYNKMLNRWILSVPNFLDKPIEKNRRQVIALDPGVRTFLTGYDNSGNAFEFGKNDISGLARLLHRRNQLQSKMTMLSSKKKRNHRRALLRINYRLKNLINDAHRRVIVFLTKNYKEIHIPKLNFHNLGKMSKKTKAKTVAWNHCLFVDRLVSYSASQKTNVIVCTEEYTSKTCSSCGNLKNNLGSNKTYNCSSCNKVFDRDINAAKNILLKSLFRN